MNFGIIELVLIGNIIRGKVKEAIVNTSKALKKWELFEASAATFKKEPWKESSNISEPLNIFRPKTENLPKIPNGLILDVVASK